MTTEQFNPPTDDVEPLSVEPDGARSSRRGMFAATIGGLGAVMLAACGREPQESIGAASEGAVLPAPTASSAADPRAVPRRRTERQQAPRAAAGATPVPRQEAPSAGDLAIGATAASLEQLAVNTYSAALDAATSGALGEVPPAVAEFVTTALDHHQAYLDAWNGVLTSAGEQAVSSAPPELEQSVNDQFGMVTDVGGAAQLALMLEQVAGATYTAALGDLESTAAIDLAGSIQYVTRQRVAVLLFVLGMYPVPETFVSVDMAFAGGPLPTPVSPATR